MENKQSKIPRKIPQVKPSKYEASEAIHTNKKYWTKVFSELDVCKLSPEKESQRLSEVLPKNLYKRVCDILEMPEVEPQHEESLEIKEHIIRRIIKEPLLSSRKSLYVNRELESDTDVEYPSDEESEGEFKPNIHQQFLSKPEREQVTWATRYLQPEKEEEKSLIRKADDLTDRIANEFCEYMKQLGGNQQSQLFKPKAIKELFQIEFDTHVARSLKVVTKELPCVEDRIAAAVGEPEKSEYAAVERQITRDIKEEERPDAYMAFGHSFARHDQWRAPRNNTKALWRSARHVPKDLVTLKTVWEGITNLRSVREYCRWMIEHPEYRRAPYLTSLGMFDPAVLEARQTFEAGSRWQPVADPNSPAPVENIRKRLSELAQ
ncbi:uncharacterized protein LOC128669602 [Plodia interpunctella]|uniref:uncharacterized protein LOC128669602 n=1 Tax=Plodia interpunctella TaxID=58824 RepID=UPI0023680DF0|nr:uncharacterized protein LOC128669602 [Plodia interpunctella]